jgi:leucyl/phenylalanyl-tRNA--protein transferase
MVYRIDDELVFPDPYYGDEDGLIAVGGDLSVERLLLAYSNGIFPWYAFEYHEDIMWYCPLKRFVIFPEEIHISHSMRTLINKERYRVSMNEALRKGCRKPDWCLLSPRDRRSPTSRASSY